MTASTPVANTNPPAPSHSMQVTPKNDSLQGLLSNLSIKARFEEMLGKKAAGFLSSLLTLTNNNAMLSKANPRSILSAAAIAASLDLPVNPNLGFAHIVPYKNKQGESLAQFQLGWKGFVQLAIRTGRYKTMNAVEIYEGELVEYNRLTGETFIDPTKRTSNKIIGYFAYFRLIMGFEKSLYMTMENVKAHAQKYSKAYAKDFSPWQTNFDAMALKTVIKLLLSKWGVLSIEMERALTTDQGVIKVDQAGTEEVTFEDNPEGEVVDITPETDEDTPKENDKAAPATAKDGELFANQKKK